MVEAMVKERTIGDELDLFIKHLESLHEALPVTMLVLQGVEKFAQDDFKKFLDSCEDENDKKIIKPEQFRQFKKKHAFREKFSMSRTLVPRSFLVTMVSQYDAYLGRLLKVIYLTKPETFNHSNRQFTFSDICEYKTIDAFREHAIEREIESVLRQSHSEQFKSMEQRFGLPLTKGLEIWPRFIELTERRNLFVHTDGMVSKQYLSVCKQNKYDIQNIREGSQLEVPHEYFIGAYRCLYEIGIKLGHTLWRKLFPSEHKDSEDKFLNATYELIERGEYELACQIIENALKCWKFTNEKIQLMLTVNCAQSYKWANGQGKCLEILKNVDWSAKSKDFKLADTVLRDDWKECVNLMRQIGIEGEISKEGYKHWPLFKELRKQKTFLDAYKDIFGEEFNAAEEEPGFYPDVKKKPTLNKKEPAKKGKNASKK